jgi:hypothetical protein
MGSTNTTSATTGLTFEVPRLGISEVAAMESEQLQEVLAESASAQASLAGLISLALAEFSRRQAFRAEGATSAEAWMVERTGVGRASARTFAAVGERLFDLPRLSEALCSGAVPFDKVRAVAGSATPETDAAWAEAAAEHSVQDLVELVRSQRPPSRDDARSEHEARSLRCNDALRTVTAQLPRADYAAVRAALETRAKAMPSDGETRWDQRLADALVALVRDDSGSGRPGPTGRPGRRSPYIVVAHVPLETLLDESSELGGELERGGLISADVVRRLACEARVIVALDDDAGHTMYEGRQVRDATAAQRREIMRRDRHCRFPGCTNVIFTEPHHLREWVRDRGPTDIDNLCCVCEHHHNLIHLEAWTVSGDANDELTFVGPSGRVMTSRPSPLWTRVTAGLRAPRPPAPDSQAPDTQAPDSQVPGPRVPGSEER